MQAIQRHTGQISENARCLQISPLYRPRNDVRWGFSQFGLNADAVKIEQQRSKEYDQLMAEWDIMAARNDDESITWYRADIISALSTIPGLTRLAYAFGDSDLGFFHEDFKHKARIVDCQHIDYVAIGIFHGYRGLHSLSFRVALPQVANTIIHGETAPDVLFSYLFHVALPQHHRSLKNLRLPNMDPDLYTSFQRNMDQIIRDF
ncbi:hypothetical protein BJ912DRAFT_986766, partial [Pholiota molesta]